ncbi:MAG TPA: ABC transporter substrate-binding protein [Aliidongia sp.]|nr:ABC transporter substrate-binding protein [Aliidongia sp.]
MAGGVRAAAIGLAFCALALPATAQTLKIGLGEDPDALDPALGRTFVGRQVFAALCDKLFDITPSLDIVPQLATGYSWSEDEKKLTITLREDVLFQDGEKLDAAAVKYNIERSLTLPGSSRKSEFPPVEAVTIVDPLTVRIELKVPFAPLLSVLTDRAGMMVSPKAAEAAGTNFASHPVCAGPFKFAERVPQDRIVVEKFDRYWNKDHIKLDRIIYRPMADGSVRIANLRSGDLDMIERILPPDFRALEKDGKFATASIPGLGYQGITINIANGAKAAGPFAKDARVREAFNLAIDRDAINQVLNEGLFVPDDQFVSPVSPFHDEGPAPKRDIEKAKALLAEAGVPHPSFTLMIPAGSPAMAQLSQIVQAMAAEAGFEVKLQATDLATALAAARRGDFEAFLLEWSGRTDPDGNSYGFLHSGGVLNDGHYADDQLDELLDEARSAGSTPARKAFYDRARPILERDQPIVYLYHQKWLWGFTKELKGFVPTPDGIVRVADLTKG